MATKLNKIYLPIETNNVEINDFIQDLISTVGKIREKQIQHGVVDNKIMVLGSNTDRNITLQYYDIEIIDENKSGEK